jgi:hypothetical protein
MRGKKKRSIYYVRSCPFSFCPRTECTYTPKHLVSDRPSDAAERRMHYIGHPPSGSWTFHYHRENEFVHFYYKPFNFIYIDSWFSEVFGCLRKVLPALYFFLWLHSRLFINNNMLNTLSLVARTSTRQLYDYSTYLDLPSEMKIIKINAVRI